MIPSGGVCEWCELIFKGVRVCDLIFPGTLVYEPTLRLEIDERVDSGCLESFRTFKIDFLGQRYLKIKRFQRTADI